MFLKKKNVVHSWQHRMEYITNNIEISSDDSDRDDSNEENDDEENYNKKNWV